MIVLGQYKEIYNNNNLPRIFDNISDVPIENKNMVLRYLKSHKPKAASPQIVYDVISGEVISEQLTCTDDGKYAWRSDVVYYFEKYNLLLPNDFIKHALYFLISPNSF